jgi:mRNA interferase MazF
VGVVASTNRIRAGLPYTGAHSPIESFNQSRIATVVIAVMTSNLSLAEAPCNVRIGKTESGLSKASVVNNSQAMTVDRELLTERVRAVTSTTMRTVDEGLRLVFGL